MYKTFYGLTRDPFEISPDPYFLVQTPRHNEAIANLFYGVKRQKGLVVLTGEVGTGKTLLVRCLLELFRREEKVTSAYVFNTVMSPLEFLQYIMGDFGLRSAASKSEILLELNRFLLSRHQRGLTTALVVDEGQLLSWNVMEEIRLLTNLETAERKLLQIVLVGQPELDTKLDSQESRQLKQRIALRCQLEPLSLEETQAYVQRRLQLAGGGPESYRLFPESTIAYVHNYSGGIPRLINTICRNALITSFAQQVRTVSPETVSGVASDFRFDLPTAPSSAPTNGHMDINSILKQLFHAAELVEAQKGVRGTSELAARRAR
jgi:general secretion pathway protein A